MRRRAQGDVATDQVGGPVAEPLELVDQLFLELWSRGDDTEVVDVMGAHRDGARRVLRHDFSFWTATDVRQVYPRTGEHPATG
jgi:hypothetical protein